MIFIEYFVSCGFILKLIFKNIGHGVPLKRHEWDFPFILIRFNYIFSFDVMTFLSKNTRFDFAKTYQPYL